MMSAAPLIGIRSCQADVTVAAVTSSCESWADDRGDERPAVAAAVVVGTALGLIGD